MRLRRLLSRSVFAVTYLPLLATLAVASGCLGDDTGGTGPITGSIAVSAAQPVLQTATGLSAVTTVTVTRTGGYNAIVVLTADSLPAGVTASFLPEALGGTSTTALLTLTSASTAVAGTSTINIRASGAETATVSTTVAVTVVLGGFELGSPATAVTAPQGGVASVPLTLTRSNGFASPVTLLAEGLPANVTATFTPALLPDGTGTSTLVLAAAQGAVLGTSTVTVRARSAGKPDKTVPVQFTVSASSARDFSLAATPAALRVVAGTSAQTTLALTRLGGHTDNVVFSASAPPTGVTYAFSPNPANGNSTTLTVTTSASATPGTYPITVTGTGGGAHSIPLSLTIVNAPGIAVALTPGTLTIAPGGTAQSAVQITRLGGFTGDFVMTAEGLPAGVTATFTPTPVQGNASILSLTATAAATTGSFTLVVRATAGSDFGTASIPVTVRAQP